MTIFYFGTDFFFSTQFVETAKALGLQVRLIESVQHISQQAPSGTIQLGEPLIGQTADLVRTLAAAQPRGLVFDLNCQALPWREWLPIIKSSAATRRIPVLAFGSHILTEALNSARHAGVEQVVSNGQFAKQLPSLLQTLIAPTQPIPWAADIATQPLPPLAQSGIAHFNAGEFYRAHDDLEAAWVAETGAVRDLYRAILQVGIAYYQIQRGNYGGAVKMLLRVKQWLHRLPDICQGVDVTQLRQDALKVESKLLELGAEGIATFPAALLRPVRVG